MSDDHGKTLLEWQCQEFEKHVRGTAWYFWMTLFGGVLVLVAILSGNFLFALILVLASVLLIRYELRGPRQLVCSCTDKGVLVGDVFYPYDTITEFHLVYEPPAVKKLYLQCRSILAPHVAVMLENQNPLEVRKVLKKYLPENVENPRESLGDMIARILKI